MEFHSVGFFLTVLNKFTANLFWGGEEEKELAREKIKMLIKGTEFITKKSNQSTLKMRAG